MFFQIAPLISKGAYIFSNQFIHFQFYSGLAKRLLGAKCELREMAINVLGSDPAKRLLGADSALAPRSLLAKSYSFSKSTEFYYRGTHRTIFFQYHT